jgi:hypothetical protein
MVERKTKLQEKEMAIEFVKEIQRQFTQPIIENLDKFLDNQNYDDKSKSDFRKMLMITIANSILMQSGARKKEIKEAYKGLIADYNEIK